VYNRVETTRKVCCTFSVIISLMIHSGVMGTCFGPPPLPPKRSSCDARRQSLNRRNRCLTSTYRSFRDPSEEDEIIVVASEDVEVASITARTHSKQYSCGSMSSSLSRKNNASSSMIPLSVVSRSHSDGNLTNCTRRGAATSSGSANLNAASGTLNRCLRALGSSWKNLLHCECCSLNRTNYKFSQKSSLANGTSECNLRFQGLTVLVVVQVKAVFTPCSD
jgi:hypothetical protein